MSATLAEASSSFARVVSIWASETAVSALRRATWARAVLTSASAAETRALDSSDSDEAVRNLCSDSSRLLRVTFPESTSFFIRSISSLNWETMASLPATSARAACCRAWSAASISSVSVKRARAKSASASACLRLATATPWAVTSSGASTSIKTCPFLTWSPISTFTARIQPGTRDSKGAEKRGSTWPGCSIFRRIWARAAIAAVTFGRAES